MTLKLPDRHGRFIVSCDDSDKAVGFVLEQSDASGARRPVALGVGSLTRPNTIIQPQKRNVIRSYPSESYIASASNDAR